MVPDGFGDFFLGIAGVAGALIGLLFVAVSVRPEAAARTAEATERERPIVALSALLNVLTMSLLALIPGVNLGSVAVWLGAIGLASMAAVVVILVADRRRGSAHRTSWIATLGGLFLVAGQTAAYVFQLISGIALQADPELAGQVTAQAFIAVVLVIVAVTRAWEFIGADRAGLTSTLLRLIVGERVQRSNAAADDSAEPDRRNQGTNDPS